MTNIQAQLTAFGTIYIDSVSGETFWSMSSLAKASVVEVTTVRRALQRGDILGLKKAEVLTTQGLRMVTLFPAIGSGASVFIQQHNPGLAADMLDAGATIYLHQAAGFIISSSGSAELNATLKALWNSQRDNHRLIYHRNMNANEAEKLHRLAFGESIADYKARRPVFAEALENDTSNERFSPDHSDVEEIQKLVLLRRSFVRAKQAHKSNPYAVAVAALNA